MKTVNEITKISLTLIEMKKLERSFSLHVFYRLFIYFFQFYAI